MNKKLTLMTINCILACILMNQVAATGFIVPIKNADKSNAIKEEITETVDTEEIVEEKTEEEKNDSEETADTEETEETVMPNSVLYYGTVENIIKDDDGNITQIALSSERYGEYIMNVSEETVWVDSGNYCASNPSDLEVGEEIYIFHSAVSTRSLPPQSAAYAVVRNIPTDVGCAMYHKVEAVEKDEDGNLKITTDNGGLYIRTAEETKFSPYMTKNIVTPRRPPLAIGSCK